jgi:hypothetical protein
MRLLDTGCRGGQPFRRDVHRQVDHGCVKFMQQLYGLRAVAGAEFNHRGAGPDGVGDFRPAFLQDRTSVRVG